MGREKVVCRGLKDIAQIKIYKAGKQTTSYQFINYYSFYNCFSNKFISHFRKFPEAEETGALFFN